QPVNGTGGFVRVPRVSEPRSRDTWTKTPGLHTSGDDYTQVGREQRGQAPQLVLVDPHAGQAAQAADAPEVRAAQVEVLQLGAGEVQAADGAAFQGHARRGSEDECPLA